MSVTNNTTCRTGRLVEAVRSPLPAEPKGPAVSARRVPGPLSATVCCRYSCMLLLCIDGVIPVSCAFTHYRMMLLPSLVTVSPYRMVLSSSLVTVSPSGNSPPTDRPPFSVTCTRTEAALQPFPCYCSPTVWFSTVTKDSSFYMNTLSVVNHRTIFSYITPVGKGVI